MHTHTRTHALTHTYHTHTLIQTTHTHKHTRRVLPTTIILPAVCVAWQLPLPSRGAQQQHQRDTTHRSFSELRCTALGSWSQTAGQGINSETVSINSETVSSTVSQSVSSTVSIINSQTVSSTVSQYHH